MEQPVYIDMDTLNRLQMQQNTDESMMQTYQQQSIIMSGGDQPQEVIIQDDSQHIVYSPIKQSEQQYLSQVEPMQGQQYLIQSPGQQPQVLYANISPQNQLNHNLIAQQNQNQQKFVISHQGQQKVVVQRNPDILQSATNMAQIVDHSNQQIQYLTTGMDQNQTQQFIIHQQPPQIKQTIYPQQQNQVMAQPQYMLQTIQHQNIQQGSPKVVMQGNQVRYIAKPQQQQQQIMTNQGGQMMQITQQPQLFNQSQVRQPFRTRLMTPQLKLQAGSPQLQQQQQMIPRNRVPRPRVVRPQAHNSLIPQQAMQNNQQPRPAQQQKIVYIVQNQPDGSKVLVPHPNYNSTGGQTIRLVQQKVMTQQPQNQQSQFQITTNQMNELQQQRTSQVEEMHAPTTSTFTPKKDGECDDLEESITATAISKSTRSEPPPLQPQQGVSLEEYRKRTLAVNRVGVVRPMMSNVNNQLPNRNPAQQVIRQRPAPRPPQFQQPGLNQQLEIPERESAKMLVILDNGEQRLITFTLPKETCTVQELLDQVGIQVGADSNIECIENPNSEIDYIVKVGNFASRDTAAMTKAAENHIRQQHRQLQTQRNTILTQQVAQPPQEVVKSKSPEIKAPPTKIVPGFFAVCGDCGFSGHDHAKCVRCNRVFKEEPKMQRMPASEAKTLPTQAVASSTQTLKLVAISRGCNSDKKDQIEALQKKHQMATAQKLNTAARGGRGGLSARGRGQRRAKPAEPVVVDLISDDDDDGSDESKSSVAKALALKKAELLLQKKSFEPDIVEDIVADNFTRDNVEEFSDDDKNISTSFSCRTIRIGTYKFDSKEKVVITSKGIKIVAPSLKNPAELLVLNIQNSEIVKIVAHFSKQLHIIFLYTKPSCARYINEQLSMTPSDKAPYFSPLSRSEPQKKIVFLAETVTDETKNTIRSIFSKIILEEIHNRDANEMLVRSTGIPLLNQGNNSASQSANTTADGTLPDEDVKQLFIYPPTGKGGLQISTNDYVCLGAELYLNDVIIDFYLKYLHQDILTQEQREKTHIFSQFFYKRLTQMNRDKDSKLTAAQKRHARVANWTKNVNIFEKDYVIIPINEQSHWFLAIVCFPNLTEPHTMDSNQPIKLIPQKKLKKKASPVQIGNTTITPLSKKEESINVFDDGGSERDEAEGDESDLASNMETDEEEEVIDKGQPVKIPSILIFDSLLGAPRAKVVATLRDYLTCEYKAKYPNEPTRTYNKTVMSGNQVKVPQQNNFFDCGVFLLHYVEQFFKDPIKDYRMPIKSLMHWFHHDDVTRKREEIAKIIESLANKNHPEGIDLPELILPTKDGKIIEVEPEEAAAADAFDESEYVPTEEDMNQNGSQPTVEKTRFQFTKKRSLEKGDSSSGESSAKVGKICKKNKSS